MAITHNRAVVFATICAAYSLTSCTSPPYQSTPIDNKFDFTKPLNGMPYYLPKSLVPITITGTAPASTGKQYTLAITFGASPIYVPDDTETFFLFEKHSLFSDDHFTIKTDSTGLLQGVNLIATDQSGNVLVQLAKLAAQISAAPAQLGFGAPLTTPPKAKAAKAVACSLPAYQYAANLDTTGTITAPPDLIGNNGESISFQIGKPTTDAPSKILQNSGPTLPTVNAIYFRMPVPYTFTIKATVSTQAQNDCLLPESITQTATASLPNGGQIFAEDISRAFVEQRTINLTIQNGMLTGVDDTHPSEIYSFAQIPSNILAPILSIPSQILTFHIQEMQNQGTLTAADAALLQDQLNVINNGVALQKAH